MKRVLILSFAMLILGVIGIVFSGCGQQTAPTTPSGATLSTAEAQKVGKAIIKTFLIDDLISNESHALGASVIKSVKAQDITLLTQEASGDWAGWWHLITSDTDEIGTNEAEQVDFDAHGRLWIVFPDGIVREITNEADFQYVDVDYDPTEETPNNLRKILLAGKLISSSVPPGAYRDEIVAGAPMGKIGESLIYVTLENVTSGTTQEIAVSGIVTLYWTEAGEPLTDAAQVVFQNARVNLSTGYPEAGASAYWVFATGVAPVPIMSGDIYFTGGKYANIRIVVQGGSWDTYYYRLNLDDGDVEYVSGGPPGPPPGTFPPWAFYH